MKWILVFVLNVGVEASAGAGEGLAVQESRFLFDSLSACHVASVQIEGEHAAQVATIEARLKRWRDIAGGWNEERSTDENIAAVWLDNFDRHANRLEPTDAQLVEFQDALRRAGIGGFDPKTADDVRAIEAAALSVEFLRPAVQVTVAELEGFVADYGPDGAPRSVDRFTRYLRPACLPYGE
jgi:hypothetical protein